VILGTNLLSTILLTVGIDKGEDQINIVGASTNDLKEAGYCKRDRKGYADHRPVMAVFEIR
jgi:hypothetical protein